MRTLPRLQTRSPHVVRIATALSKVMTKWISTTGTQVPQINSNVNHVAEVSAGPVLLLVTTGIVYIARQWVQARDEAGKYTFWDNQIGNDWRQCIMVLLWVLSAVLGLTRLDQMIGCGVTCGQAYVKVWF